MQGICTHIPETNYVPRECSVAAILLLLFMVLLSLLSVLNLLYFYISTFGSICAVPNMAVSVVPVLLFYYYYYYYYYPTMWASTASSRRTNFTKALCPSSKESLSLKKTLEILIPIILYFNISHLNWTAKRLKLFLQNSFPIYLSLF